VVSSEGHPRLIAGIDPAAVLPLGDDQYDDGRLGKFRRSYDLGWGRQRWRSRPVLGNHEYEASSRAAGYFAYFGRRAGPPDRGWYSYDLGAWHLIALNSNCVLVRCDPGSPQMTWLGRDLAAHASTCTLAYFHHPRFSSGPHGDDPELLLLRPMWRVLYAAGVDVVLNGHDHLYERFAPMDPHGRADRPFGVRQFTVGTGGPSTTRSNGFATRVRSATRPRSVSCRCRCGPPPTSGDSFPSRADGSRMRGATPVMTLREQRPAAAGVAR
jgi:hypothetical protein